MFFFLALSLLATQVGGKYTVNLNWTPNPVSQGVSSYRILIDDIAITRWSCTTTVCNAVTTVGGPNNGNHTASVAGVNNWGIGVPTVIKFTCRNNGGCKS